MQGHPISPAVEEGARSASVFTCTTSMVNGGPPGLGPSPAFPMRVIHGPMGL
jgi:hypothetical protein